RACAPCRHPARWTGRRRPAVRHRGRTCGPPRSAAPVTLSALSIPTASNRLAQLVEEHRTVLEKVTTRDRLEFSRETGQLRAFVEYSDDDLWAAIESHRSSAPGIGDEEALDLKLPEWQAFSQADPERNTADFRLTR